MSEGALTARGLGCGALRLSPRVLARGAAEVSLTARRDEGGLVIEGELVAREALALDAINIDIEYIEQKISEDWRFFRHGYASWTPSASFPVGAPPRRPLAFSFAVANHYVDSPLWRERRAMVGHGFGVLGGPGEALLLGHLRSDAGLSEIALCPGPRLVASLNYGGKRLEAGERLALEPLRLAWGEPHGLLDAYVAEVAAGAGLASFADRDAPVGWCSWYHFYTSVRDEDMVRNADQLARKPQLGVRVVQLDDGYQTAVGDWRSLNGKFARGLGPLAADLRARGFEAGLWTAPFMAGRRSRLYAEHRDWILRDAQGRPIDCGLNPAWMDRVVGLDLSHPGALAWLGELFSGLRAEGFSFFKLDFLYAALRCAAAHDGRLSPVERYRRGLDVIREAVGPDSFILGCGAPILPSVGKVHGMRVSSDVKESWGPGPIGWVGQDCGAASLREAARNNLTRAALHRVWWLNDPDCLLVRDRNTALDLSEVQLLVLVAGLTGGLGLISDDMEAVPPERLRLLELVLPPHRGRPRAPDLFLRPFPETFALEGQGRRLEARLNWSDGPVDRPLDPAPVWRFDVLERRLLPAGPLSVPRHGARAFWETPRDDRPRLVGTDLHLGALTDGSLVESWEAPTLRITLQGPAGRAGTLWVAVPAGWRLDEITGGERAPWADGVCVHASHGAELTLRFTRDQVVP